LPTDAGQIVVGPGSKALLYGLVLALEGDVVLPRPSWVSYEPQALLAGRRTLRVDVPEACGGVPDPALLAGALAGARRGGLDPRLLILTLPDNPTGTHAPPALLADVLAIAREQQLTVVSDEIYGELLHRGTLTSAAALDEGCIVTGGLSKSLALGG